MYLWRTDSSTILTNRGDLVEKQVYCGRYAADSVVALFQREKVTISHCVPTILRMLLDSAKAKGINLSGCSMVRWGQVKGAAFIGEEV